MSIDLLLIRLEVFCFCDLICFENCLIEKESRICGTDVVKRQIKVARECVEEGAGYLRFWGVLCGTL